MNETVAVPLRKPPVVVLDTTTPDAIPTVNDASHRHHIRRELVQFGGRSRIRSSFRGAFWFSRFGFVSLGFTIVVSVPWFFLSFLVVGFCTLEESRAN